MGKQDKEKQKKNNATRHAFLLTFFSEGEHYDEVLIHGYTLIKQWNGATKRWEVAIYTPESYENKQHFSYTPHDTATDVSSSD